MKKITTILILALTSLFANAQDIQMAPGSMLSVYQLEKGQTFWNQGQEPINTIIDRTQSFSVGEALWANNETKNYAKLPYIAVNWMGFIEIKEAGTYVFSLQFTEKNVKTTVYLNDKAYMVLDNASGGLMASNAIAKSSSMKTLKLDPGFYKLNLVKSHPFATHLAASRDRSESFIGGYKVSPALTYWNKLSPTNKTAITPATLMLKRK